MLQYNVYNTYIGVRDPYVELVLMPEKLKKTEMIKANVNPYNGKEFTM